MKNIFVSVSIEPIFSSFPVVWIVMKHASLTLSGILFPVKHGFQ